MDHYDPFALHLTNSQSHFDSREKEERRRANAIRIIARSAKKYITKIKGKIAKKSDKKIEEG